MNHLLPKSTIAARKKKRRTNEITTSVKLPRALDRALKQEARSQQRSQSWVIRAALQSYISFRQVEEKK